MNESGKKPFAVPVGFLAILIVVSSINPLVINMFVPSMPGIMRSLGTDFSTVQLVLSYYLFATAVAQLVIGPLSDRYGRRPILLAGLLIFDVASLLCTVAPSIGVLLFARVLQGIGGCAGVVIARAVVRDRYSREQAASMIAYVIMGYAVAPMIGPVIGGIIEDHLGWRSNFGLVLGIGILTTVFAWRFLPETRVHRGGSASTSSFFAGLIALARIPSFWAFTIAGSAASTVFFVFLGAASFVSSELLGLSGTAFGLYFFFVSFGYMAGNFLTGRYGSRFGIFALIVVGAVVNLLSVAVMVGGVLAGWLSPLLIFVPMYVGGFANGLVLPNSVAGAVSARPDLAGAAAGLNGSTQIAMGAVATVAVGWLIDLDPTALPMVLGMLFFAVVSLAAGIWARTARS
jgi:DHA1 family bicyclomycin/chloramphenicol resistance-like MFS transporter